MRYIPVAQLGTKKKKRQVPLRSRVGPLADADFDLYEETGLFYDQYHQILQTHRDEIAALRTVGRQNTVGSLCVAAGLFMELNYLRDGGYFAEWLKDIVFQNHTLAARFLTSFLYCILHYH